MLFVVGPSAEPQNVSVSIESSFLVTISWGLPIERGRNGVVISYEVNCIVAGSTHNSTTATVLVNNATFDSPSKQSYQISAKHHSSYVCRVSASTVNGSGPASLPSNFSVELPELAVSPNGGDSVVVRWEVPQVVVDPVLSTVNLVYHVVGGSEAKMRITVSVNLTDWTITNLSEMQRMHTCMHTRFPVFGVHMSRMPVLCVQQMQECPMPWQWKLVCPALLLQVNQRHSSQEN